MTQDNYSIPQSNDPRNENDETLYDSIENQSQHSESLDLNLRNEQADSGQYTQPNYAQPSFEQPVADSTGYAQPGYSQQNYGQPQQGYSAQGYNNPTYNQAPNAGYAQPGPGANQQNYGNFQPNYAVAPAQQYAPAQQKSKVAAGLLGIFLGTLGIHNFYTGRTGIALIQLIGFLGSFILYIVFIGPLIQMAIGLWAFIEGILYLTGSGSYAYDAKGVPLS